MNKPPAVIISGICLTGKTTLAKQILGLFPMPTQFVEGDSLHDSSSIEKMRSGQPLSELDRKAWQQRICKLVADRCDDRLHLVTCSALSKSFRDELRHSGRVRFIFLSIGHDSAMKRAEKRLRDEPDHPFQPAKYPALLDGQFRDLQAPDESEKDCYLIDLDNEPQGPDGPIPNFESHALLILAWLAQADNEKSDAD